MRSGHSERCPDCKLTIRRTLESLYGLVECDKTFNVPRRLHSALTPFDKLVPALLDGALRAIYQSLQDARGMCEFVKGDEFALLPPCDYFAVEPGFVVEFDESQHFTRLRAITLERYPDDLAVGFDRKHWIDLCVRIQAQDNHPPYRDEQRAWYDTLRDFLPAFVRHLVPTVRLYAREATWCQLSETDLKEILRQKVASGTTGRG